MKTPLAAFLAIVLAGGAVEPAPRAAVTAQDGRNGGTLNAVAATIPADVVGRLGATVAGTWAYAERSYGSGYLAIPEGPGWVVTVCGPLDCIERVSTDAGPELRLQRAGRIGDLAAVMFEDICGPLSAGLCDGSYTIIGRPDQHPDDPPEHPDDARMRLEDRELPATDQEDPA
jgi:hypothetical protein